MSRWRICWAVKIERDDAGRFYLANQLGRLPMPMVAEGLRKDRNIGAA